MKVSFDELKNLLQTALQKEGLAETKASVCAQIFAGNSRDGIHSHGLNRFPVFIQRIREGLVNIYSEPALVSSMGMIEQWDGCLAPGMYNASLCMKRAIQLAKLNGLGCVTIRNTNHWMRGGTYGWQAAEETCIAICATNTRANMPPWGGTTPTLGNNPLVIAVPRSNGHIVLDIALSQFSYGKLQEYELNKQELPIDGGYDESGRLSKNPSVITNTKRSLPIGLWKGSGLSMLLDMLVAGLSGGRSVSQITKEGKEYGVSQFFLCIDAKGINKDTLDDIIAFTKDSIPAEKGKAVYYPGEQTLTNRLKSVREGIEVNKTIWQEVKHLGG
jgi:3-dehydro-L-gulonate 2-dehydrogenase